MLILKQSTSVDIRIGPFLDATDGVTPETGITLGAADQAEVLKANGAATVAMAGTFAAVTGADGWYDYTVATGDVDTVGEVVFVVQDSSVCLPVFVRAYVVEEAVYDDLYAASAAGYAGVSELATVDTNVDAILVDTGTTLPASIATIDTNVDSVLTDTGTTLPASIATIDSNVDAILVDTGTTLNDAIAAIAADQKPKVNTALNNIPIYMVLASDNKTPATGLTPTVTISQDGGAFAAINGSSSIAEVGSGWYRLNLVAADMNAAVIFINVTGTGANPVPLTISTVD